MNGAVLIIYFYICQNENAGRFGYDSNELTRRTRIEFGFELCLREYNRSVIEIDLYLFFVWLFRQRRKMIRCQNRLSTFRRALRNS